jgi:long-chain acyl-CoA synthetase
MLRTVVAAMALALCTGMATAAEVGGVKLDDKLTVGGQELVLNGAGIRTKLVFKVYVAGLYVPAKASSVAAVLEKAPRRIQLTLMRDVSAEEFVEALVDGIKANTTAAELAAAKAGIDQLSAIGKALGQVKEKDVVTLDFVDGGTKMAVNGAAKGTIPGEAFNRALLKIWLGDNPVQADLKKAMLGG